MRKLLVLVLVLLNASCAAPLTKNEVHSSALVYGSIEKCHLSGRFDSHLRAGAENSINQMLSNNSYDKEMLIDYLTYYRSSEFKSPTPQMCKQLEMVALRLIEHEEERVLSNKLMGAAILGGLKDIDNSKPKTSYCQNTGGVITCQTY